MCEFALQFAGAETVGDVRGSGTDDVGYYVLDGRYSRRTRRVAFSKVYHAGTRNKEGRMNSENKGHRVEYRGTCSTLASGIRGTWTIRSSLGNFEGTFHLWPIMENWQDADLESYEIDGECCVCLDRAISTRLHPCGHFALCRVCADQLNPRKCPICRAPIERYRQ